MSVEENFGHLFKPEVKSSGRKLFVQDKISLRTQSDSAVQAYVRTSPPFKVQFVSGGVSSSSFEIECSCPAARKSRFCKHVWATLLCVEKSHPDFLSEKSAMEKSSSDVAADERNTYQESAKQKASEYRKDQYQKQKARLKEKKREKIVENPLPSRSFAPHIEAALDYFSQNGFPMPSGPVKEILVEAKRKLSRLFHPDRGGTHDESVELNQHCEALQQFLIADQEKHSR